jgi:uracil-DNA glycosylase
LTHTKPALIIGQAQKQETRDTPFIKSHLWKWFETIGYSQTDIMKLFQFDALVNHGTLKGKKGRVPPTSVQIKTYLPELVKKIDIQKPKLIVPVGNLAIRYLFNEPGILLEQVIGEKFTLHPFGACKKETLVIPLPHPSGVSLWLNSASNKKRLKAALELVKQEISRK